MFWVLKRTLSSRWFFFGYSKEPSHRDGSFKHQQHIFWLRNKNNNILLRTLIWGPEIYWLCCCDLSKQLNRDMRFPTMWHFDKCRLRPACTDSFKFLLFKQCTFSRVLATNKGSDQTARLRRLVWDFCWSHIPQGFIYLFIQYFKRVTYLARRPVYHMSLIGSAVAQW